MSRTLVSKDVPAGSYEVNFDYLNNEISLYPFVPGQSDLNRLVHIAGQGLFYVAGHDYNDMAVFPANWQSVFTAPPSQQPSPYSSTSPSIEISDQEIDLPTPKVSGKVGFRTLDGEMIVVDAALKCTCGSASVGSPFHSDWCDLYVPQPK